MEITHQVGFPLLDAASGSGAPDDYCEIAGFFASIAH